MGFEKFKNGLLAIVGYMLSPLSWWNDAIVNLPIALALAWIVSNVWPSAFEITLIVGYWLTNVLGLMMLHKGLTGMFSADGKKFSWKTFWKDVLISVFYTVVIIILIKLKIFAPFPEYFKGINQNR